MLKSNLKAKNTLPPKNQILIMADFYTETAKGREQGNYILFNDI